MKLEKIPSGSADRTRDPEAGLGLEHLAGQPRASFLWGFAVMLGLQAEMKEQRSVVGGSTLPHPTQREDEKASVVIPLWEFLLGS